MVSKISLTLFSRAARCLQWLYDNGISPGEVEPVIELIESLASCSQPDNSQPDLLEAIRSLKTPVSIAAGYRTHQLVSPDVATRLTSCRREIKVAVQEAVNQYEVTPEDIINYHHNAAEVRRFVQYILFEFYDFSGKEIARFFRRETEQITKDRSIARSALKDRQLRDRFNMLKARIDKALEHEGIKVPKK